MFACTNLVIELGVVLWILMGWRFVLTEFVGAYVLSALVGLMGRFFMPKNVRDDRRKHAEKRGDSHSCHGNHDHAHERNGKWSAMANAFMMDWMMLWKELLVGFFMAGFIATLVRIPGGARYVDRHAGRIFYQLPGELVAAKRRD